MLRALLAALLVLQLTACGTLLFPERHGQRGGNVDPAVVIFDSALLLVFVVPGLVAFGIDFHTGAIYLPESGGDVARVDDEGEAADLARLEDRIRRHTGSDFRWDRPGLAVQRYRDPAAFRDALADLAPDVAGRRAG